MSFGMLLIAVRNLRRNLRRTLITGLAIAGGLAMLIWADTLSQGTYDGLIRRGVSTMAGHVVVQAEGYEKEPDMRKLVDDAPAVEQAVAAAVPGARVVSRIQLQGLLQSTRNTSGVGVVGIDPEAERTVSDWQDKVVGDGEAEGAFLAAGDAQGILLGSELAETLDVGVGDKVVLMAQGEGEVASRLFRVRGLLHTGAAEVDGFLGLVTLPAAQAVLERPDAVTQVTVHLDDPRQVPAVRAAVQAALSGRPVEVLPWQEALPEMYEFTVLDRQSARVMFLIMGVIVAMGVLNTVLMSVMERMREFGVMLALGTRPAQVFRVILLEGVVLGAIATVIGAAVGLAATVPTMVYGIDYSALMGGSTEVGGVTMDAQVYAAWNWPGTIGFCLVAWGMTAASSLWPAWKAARLEPVAAMRHV